MPNGLYSSHNEKQMEFIINQLKSQGASKEDIIHDVYCLIAAGVLKVNAGSERFRSISSSITKQVDLLLSDILGEKVSSDSDEVSEYTAHVKNYAGDLEEAKNDLKAGKITKTKSLDIDLSQVEIEKEYYSREELIKKGKIKIAEEPIQNIVLKAAPPTNTKEKKPKKEKVKEEVIKKKTVSKMTTQSEEFYEDVFMGDVFKKETGFKGKDLEDILNKNLERNFFRKLFSSDSKQYNDLKKAIKELHESNALNYNDKIRQLKTASDAYLRYKFESIEKQLSKCKNDAERQKLINKHNVDFQRYQFCHDLSVALNGHMALKGMGLPDNNLSNDELGAFEAHAKQSERESSGALEKYNNLKNNVVRVQPRKIERVRINVENDFNYSLNETRREIYINPEFIKKSAPKKEEIKEVPKENKKEEIKEVPKEEKKEEIKKPAQKIKYNTLSGLNPSIEDKATIRDIFSKYNGNHEDLIHDVSIAYRLGLIKLGPQLKEEASQLYVAGLERFKNPPAGSKKHFNVVSDYIQDCLGETERAETDPDSIYYDFIEMYDPNESLKEDMIKKSGDTNFKNNEFFKNEVLNPINNKSKEQIEVDLKDKMIQDKENIIEENQQSYENVKSQNVL